MYFIARFIPPFSRHIAVILTVLMALAGCGDDLEKVKKAAHDSGLSQGYDKGYKEGRQAGLDNGYIKGYSAGKKDGLDALGLKKEQEIAYQMGKVAGQQDGYDQGFDDGLKRVKSGFKEEFKGPMASLKTIGVWIAMVKVLALFIYVMWFYTHDIRGDELIGKIIAMVLGPIFFIFLIQGTNSFGGIMQFLLEEGAQTGPFVSFVLFTIAVSTGISIYSFYNRFILIRHSVWTETFCVMIASAMLSLALGFLHTLLQVRHNIGDFMAANIFLAILTGSLFALMVIFTQRAERQKTTGYE